MIETMARVEDDLIVDRTGAASDDPSPTRVTGPPPVS